MGNAFKKHSNRTKPIIGVTNPNKGGTAAWIFTRFAIWRAGGTAKRLQPCQLRIDSGVQRERALVLLEPVLNELDAIIIGGGADINLTNYGVEEKQQIEKFESRATKLPWKDRIIGGFIGGIRFVLAGFSSKKSEVQQKLLSGDEQTPLEPEKHRERGDDDGLARDVMEDAFIRLARDRRLPLLGICRGSQLLALVNEGALHQELHQFYTESSNPYTPLPCKTVRLMHSQRSSLLAETLELSANDRVRINALHHQAVQNPGKNMHVAAKELPNGVPQAIEADRSSSNSQSEHGNDNDDDARDWFCLGVQWHPEYLPQRATHQLIFKRLVREAKKDMQKQK